MRFFAVLGLIFSQVSAYANEETFNFTNSDVLNVSGTSQAFSYPQLENNFYFLANTIDDVTEYGVIGATTSPRAIQRMRQRANLVCRYLGQFSYAVRVTTGTTDDRCSGSSSNGGPSIELATVIDAGGDFLSAQPEHITCDIAHHVPTRFTYLLCE